MRKGLIIGGLVTLGLVAIPSFADAGQVAQKRVETRTVTRDVRHDDHVVVRDEPRPIIRDEHRDVRVDEHVVVDHRWDRNHVEFIPAPVVVTTPVVVVPSTDTPIALNQVPATILNAANVQTGGAPIIGIDFIQTTGGSFYDVRVTAAYNTIQTLRFGLDGGFCGNV